MFPNKTSKNITFAICIENGLISGKELNEFFNLNIYNEFNWYDMGICSITVFKSDSKFKYTSYAKPLKIPSTEKGLLSPSNNLNVNIINLEKYTKVIIPLIKNGIDLYEFYSDGKLSRKSTLCDACIESLSKLNNINIYDFNTIYYDTLITFGTFDLVH